MFRERTPIESHVLNGRSVFVKRDDLYGIPPAPPLAKLRGLRHLLARKIDEGFDAFGCFETRVSNVGHGLAAAVSEIPGARCIVGYPRAGKKPPPQSVEMAADLGAETFPVRNNYVAICYAQVRKYVESQGAFMIPFGFECVEAVEAVEREAARTPDKLVDRASVIVTCGSGVTLAGLIRGFGARPARYFGVSSGRSIGKIEACLHRNLERIPRQLEIVPASMPYAEAPAIRCPFPTHPNYDLKAWEFLADHLDEVADPILFWNVGA